MSTSTRWDSLCRLLELPSVSGDPHHATDVAAAVRWVGDFVEEAGGEVERTTYDGRPLGIMRLAASANPTAAPTVMLYGHVDVQPPGEEELWTTRPFVPELRDGWLYARGAADDKGPFYVMLEAAAALAAAGELPVNVLVLCDAEEEVGGRTLVTYLDEAKPSADGCLVLDASALGPRRPALTVATRGVVSFRLQIRTGERDLHSGTYGGAALNAANVLVEALAELARDARDPARGLWAGVETPTTDELASWRELETGAARLAAQGAKPVDEDAADAFYERTWCRPAFDVHGLRAGSTESERNAVLTEASAIFSLRIAPGQDVHELGALVEERVRAAIPPAATVQITPCSQTPAAGPFPADSRFAAAAADAFGDAFGRRPLRLRAGGSLPILAPLHRLGIETVVSGLDVPDGNIHAPDERILVDHLECGSRAVRQLLANGAGLR